MRKTAYQEALTLRLRELEDEITMLHLRRQHMEGMSWFRYWWKSKLLERRQQLLESQLDHVGQQDPRLRDRMLGSIEGIAADLSCNFVEFIDRLDCKYRSDLAGRQNKHS
jgi:hypothetical protein